MTQHQWEILKWFGNICLIASTVMMVNTHVASVAITPWVLFFIGNSIWFVDSVKLENYPWAVIACLLIFWDVLIIISRLHVGDANIVFQPLITIMEKLP